MNQRPSRALSVAATLLVLAAVGCTDPTVAPKSTVTDANIWTVQTSYAQYMAKLYGGLILTGQQGPAGNGDIGGIDEGFSEYLRLFWYMQEVPTDEAVIGWTDAGLHDLNIQAWDANNQMVDAMYYRVFFQVALANEFLRQTTLDKLDARGVGPALKVTIQNFRAESRFLRALAYAHGMDFFGAIPFTTDADVVGSIPPQASRESIYNFVVSELTAIKDSLPAMSATVYGRATKPAADMLLAEVQLNAGVYTGTPHYDLALTAAQNAITDCTGCSLNPVFQNNFTADNNLSQEMIFAAVEDGTHTQTWGGMTFLVHAGCGGSMQASWFGMDYCWGGYRLKQQALRLFDTVNDSRAAFFYSAGQTDSVIDIGSFNSGRAAPKFTNKTSTGGSGSQQGMIDTDFPIFRLAEAYLIYAEANIRGGGGSGGTALGYMNQIRQRAFGGSTAHNWAGIGAITLDTMLAERGRELMFEAKRRTDLIRFGVFTGNTYLWAWKGNTPGGMTIDPKYNLYPIPANDLAANPSLVQNPGY